MNSQNGSTGHTAGGHFIHTVRHVHVSNHDHFTDILSALAILELEYMACVFIVPRRFVEGDYRNGFRPSVRVLGFQMITCE